MTPDDITAKRIDVAVQSRALEVNLFWQRSLFFWGFNAAALLALAKLHDKSLHLSLVIESFGLVASVTWTLANRSSRRWHQHWETIAQQETEALGGGLFKPILEKKVEGWHDHWLAPQRYSVGKLTIALSDFVAILWLGLVVYGLLLLYKVSAAIAAADVLVFAWSAFTFVYLGIILAAGRSYRK